MVRNVMISIGQGILISSKPLLNRFPMAVSLRWGTHTSEWTVFEGAAAKKHVYYFW